MTTHPEQDRPGHDIQPEAQQPGQPAEPAHPHSFGDVADGGTFDVENRLEQVLQDTETSIVELRRELAEMKQQRRQHEEVDRLEEHLSAAVVRWSEVKDFLGIVVSELRSKKEGISEGEGNR